MKKYLIKYEDTSGKTHTIEVSASSNSDAISKLTNCKSIYWIEYLTLT
jgi:hypothetical protein